MTKIIISIIHKSMIATPVLLAHNEFSEPEEAIKWVNIQAEQWVRKMREDPNVRFDGDSTGTSRPCFGRLTDEFLITTNDGEEIWMACINEEAIQQFTDQTSELLTVNLTFDEASTLVAKLETLMVEVNHGVDVWLAPGGVLDVNNNANPPEVFVDYSSEGVDHLNNIVGKLAATVAKAVIADFMG